MFYLNRFVLKTALFSTLALTCVTGRAQSAPPLVFTESPGDVLTASVGTASVGTVALVSVPGAAVQIWNWTPPSTDTLILTPGNLPIVDWTEPEPGNVGQPICNEVSFISVGPNNQLGLQVRSDTGIILPPVADKAVVPNWNLITTGPPSSTVAQGVQFIDNGDGPATVSEGGSTLMLLGTALCAIAFLKRKVNGQSFKHLPDYTFGQIENETI
jgi:hypothetical protein